MKKVRYFPTLVKRNTFKVYDDSGMEFFLVATIESWFLFYFDPLSLFLLGLIESEIDRIHSANAYSYELYLDIAMLGYSSSLIYSIG